MAAAGREARPLAKPATLRFRDPHAAGDEGRIDGNHFGFAAASRDVRALRALTGKDFGTRAEDWRVGLGAKSE